MLPKIKIPNLENQGSLRREAIETLSNFMQNPGWFSILLSGSRGTGKSHWIHQICEALKPSDLAEVEEKPIVFKRADQISSKRKELKKLFKSAENGILVIEDIEDLPEIPQQRLLLEALHTTDGKLGLDDSKVRVRVIFTTSQPIDQLKRDEDQLLHELLDRISQLVVELPSFAIENENILNDFEATWKKMAFEDYQSLPVLPELRDWLKATGKFFHGNFRDLDKLCILWHQYRIVVYEGKPDIRFPEEVKVWNRVRKDFERFSKFPLQNTDDSGVFQFESGKSKTVLEKEFRSKFKKWALKTYGTMQKAAKELDMSPRTMDRW